FPSGVDVPISNPNGGAQVRWRHDGKELFYIAPDAQLMAASIQTDSHGIRPGVPARLFPTHGYGSPESFGQTYVVSPDGQRFLMITQQGAVSTSSITLILNW